MDRKKLPNEEDRIEALDITRGFALLGILIMNIQSFSMPGATYINPKAYGDFNGINKIVWILGYIFADLKFLTLFSLLFGAGIILFCQKAEPKNVNAKSLHFRRMWGLFIFGIIHSYFFWYGDILLFYSICGSIAYFFKDKSSKYLIVLAIILFIIPTLYNVFMGVSIQHLPQESLGNLIENWKPSPSSIQKEISDYLGGFISAFHRRFKTSIFMQTYIFLSIFIWRITGTMLLGMAIYKSSFFHMGWKSKSYLKLLSFLLPMGLGVTVLGVYLYFYNDFSLKYGMFIGNQFTFWGSIPLAISYAIAIVFMIKSKKLILLSTHLTAIGKMAFSNYFLQTLICTTLFYGHGFSLFGKLERWHQAALTILIWIFQLWLSPIWLRYFRFGPMEWLWRSFTYKKFYPIHK
jgi:uncharacterized protein